MITESGIDLCLMDCETGPGTKRGGSFLNLPKTPRKQTRAGDLEDAENAIGFRDGERPPDIASAYRAIACSGDCRGYSAAAGISARSALTAQNLNSGIFPNGSSAGLVNR